MRWNGFKLCEGKFRLDIWKNFFSKNGGQALVQAAWGGDGVTVPGGVQEMFRCCTEGHDLVVNIGDRWMAGVDDLRGLFRPW